MKTYRYLFYLSFLLLTLAACARTVNSGKASSRRIVLNFSVQGSLALSSPNVTYYVVLNAPQDKAKQPIDAATQGPRINGPDFNLGTGILDGRLPFTGLLPSSAQSVPSVWTHFYFIQGSSDGKGVVGRGRRLPNGSAEIVQRNYPEALWRKLSDQTFELSILFSDLGYETPEDQSPSNLTVNLASSNNIDTGDGSVYDYWLSNIPFSVNTAPLNTPIQQQDPTQELIMLQIPNRVPPQLPVGIQGSQVNITAYEYKVLEL